jgi:hypothetical protein
MLADGCLYGRVYFFQRRRRLFRDGVLRVDAGSAVEHGLNVVPVGVEHEAWGSDTGPS